MEQDILLYRYREIMGNMERDRSSARSVPKDEALRQRFLDVIWEDGMVYGVSADGYGNTPGYLSFSTYCEPGVISGATRSVLAVRQYAFADVDLDGQEVYMLTEACAPSPCPIYAPLISMGSMRGKASPATSASPCPALPCPAKLTHWTGAVL